MTLTASVLLRLDWRAWLNTGHGALFGGVFLGALAAALLLALAVRAGGLTSSGAARALTLERAALVAAAVAGLAAAATGSWLIDPLFHAQAAGLSPAEALRARPGYGIWAGALLHVKEVGAWVSVAAAIAALVMSLRRPPAVDGTRRLSTRLLALGGAAFVLGGLAGVLGVLLTKLAPVM